jgi:hypothetical protein
MLSPLCSAASALRAHTLLALTRAALLPLPHHPQMELRLGPVLKRVSRALKAAERAPEGGLLPGVPPDSDADVADEEEEEEGDDDDASGSDGEEGAAGEEEEEDEEDDFPQLRRAARGGGKQPPRLPTEDAFFRLSDMERCARAL